MTVSLGGGGGGNSSHATNANDSMESVKVLTRVRPLVPIERANPGVKFALKYPSANTIQIESRNETKTFTYDHVSDEQDSQQHLYQQCIAPLVDTFMQGYNATILAYGQTGSGKTHTMGTSSCANLQPDEYGIVPRVIRDVFDQVTVKEQRKEATYIVTCSFLEIYQEDIIDLLQPLHERSASGVDEPYISEKRRKDGVIEIDVKNCKRVEVRSYQEMMDLLERGTKERSVGATNMNAGSSRSHAIFTMYMQFKENDPNSNTEPADADAPVAVDDTYALNAEAGMMTAKFHFVDLAGSERLKKTGAQGERMQEGININKGLLALGNVINQLCEGRSKHVNFRDSKITRLLQDSLGGNAKTLMIACVSPANINSEETISTLNYANRARNIQNKPVKNVDPMTAQINAFKERIRELEAALSANGQAIPGGATSSSAPAALPKGYMAVREDDYRLQQDQSHFHELEYKRALDKIRDLRIEVSSKQDLIYKQTNSIDEYRLLIDTLKQQLQQAGIAPQLPTPAQAASADVNAAPSASPDLTLLQEKNQLIIKQQRHLQKTEKQLKLAMQLLNKYHSVSAITKDGEPIYTNDVDVGSKRKKTKTDFGALEVTTDDETGTVKVTQVEEHKDEALMNGHTTSAEDDEDADIDPDTIQLDDDPEQLSGDEDENEALLTMQQKYNLQERELQNAVRAANDRQLQLGEDVNTANAALLHNQRILASLEEERVSAAKAQKEMEAATEKVKQLTAEREQVQADLAKLDAKDLEFAKKSKLLQERLNEATAKINKLQDELKDYNAKKRRLLELERQYKASTAEVTKLTAEVDEKKKQRVELQKEIASKEKKFREFLSQKDKDLAQMQRLQQKQSYQLKEAERKLQQAQYVNERRQADNAALQRQLRNVKQVTTGAAASRPATRNQQVGRMTATAQPSAATTAVRRFGRVKKQPYQVNGHRVGKDARPATANSTGSGASQVLSLEDASSPTVQPLQQLLSAEDLRLLQQRLQTEINEKAAKLAELQTLYERLSRSEKDRDVHESAMLERMEFFTRTGGEGALEHGAGAEWYADAENLKISLDADARQARYSFEDKLKAYNELLPSGATKLTERDFKQKTVMQATQLGHVTFSNVAQERAALKWLLAKQVYSEQRVAYLQQQIAERSKQNDSAGVEHDIMADIDEHAPSALQAQQQLHATSTIALPTLAAGNAASVRASRAFGHVIVEGDINMVSGTPSNALSALQLPALHIQPPSTSSSAFQFPVDANGQFQTATSIASSPTTTPSLNLLSPTQPGTAPFTSPKTSHWKVQHATDAPAEEPAAQSQVPIHSKTTVSSQAKLDRVAKRATAGKDQKFIVPTGVTTFTSSASAPNGFAGLTSAPAEKSQIQPLPDTAEAMRDRKEPKPKYDSNAPLLDRLTNTQFFTGQHKDSAGHKMKRQDSDVKGTTSNTNSNNNTLSSNGPLSERGRGDSVSSSRVPSAAPTGSKLHTNTSPNNLAKDGESTTASTNHHTRSASRPMNLTPMITTSSGLIFNSGSGETRPSPRDASRSRNATPRPSLGSSPTSTLNSSQAHAVLNAAANDSSATTDTVTSPLPLRLSTGNTVNTSLPPLSAIASPTLSPTPNENTPPPNTQPQSVASSDSLSVPSTILSPPSQASTTASLRSPVKSPATLEPPKKRGVFDKLVDRLTPNSKRKEKQTASADATSPLGSPTK